MRRRTLLTGASTALPLVFSSPGNAQPKSDLWDRWTAHQPGNPDDVDHSAWNAFLAGYRRDGAPDGIIRVDYATVTQADRALLDDYIAGLENTNIDRYDRPAQKAYWFNFYNAATVQVILDAYPVSTIRDVDISPGLFSNGPWGARLWTVRGEAVSLDDMEHRILRPIWRDPRIHYGVNCASLGCPNLAPKAFTAENTEEMLDALARTFINHARAAFVDERGRLTVSSIYEWFQNDFGGSERGVLNHMRQYASAALIRTLEGRTDYDRHDYDWSLNDALPI